MFKRPARKLRVGSPSHRKSPHIKTIIRLLVALAVLTAGMALIGPPDARAAPAPTRGLSTPELLEAAVEAGQINRVTADIYLARAFSSQGLHREIPAPFQSSVPWHGSIPLMRLQQRVAAMPSGPDRTELSRTLVAAGTSTCGSSSGTLANESTTSHFYIEYGTLGGGLTIADYQNALEQSWVVQVDNFGWAAPPVRPSSPAPGNRYPVRIDDLGLGLYGYASTGGTYAGFVGNNPATSWNDVDAAASCMVLNRSYSGFPGTPLKAMQATAAHEFHHAIQFGLGAHAGSNVPDDSFFEGSASWMEDEVFDSANDNYFYLWPVFSDSLGDYDASPYGFWFLLRGLTERFGVGVANGGEQVMQDFWEATSKGTGNNLSALALGLSAKGVTLADAFHHSSIGSAFMRTCGGGYVAPFCYKEAAGYLAIAGLPPASGSILSVGAGFSSTLEDEYSARWVSIPIGTYSLTLNNTSSGGQMRASAVCDTGSSLISTPFPAVVGAGQSTTLGVFDGIGCVRRLAVLTNQHQSPGNPANAPFRTFTLSTAAAATVPGAPGSVAASARNASALVTWSAPAQTGGSAITGYTVTSTPGGHTATVGGATLSATVAWLTNGVSYGFTVRASNAVGQGPASAPSNAVIPRFPPVADFNADLRTDIAVYRPPTGQWFISGGASTSFGLSGDIPVAGDYNNDGAAELAVFRPSVGAWYIQGQAPVFFGLEGDLPVPGDYNGDGGTDIAVYRPSTGQWFVRNQFTVSWGLSSDIPVPGDYNRDGKTDIAVYRPSTGQWFIKDQSTISWGLPGDIPVPADFDGNGSTDIAVFRPQVGGWYIREQPTVFFGLPGDVPVPAHYDADLLADIAIYRPSTGQWFIRNQPTVSWGLPSDIPAPAAPAIYRTFFSP